MSCYSDFAKSLPISYSKAHKNCGQMSEIEAKVRYVKLARSLKTYGVSFFLVKVGYCSFVILIPRLSLFPVRE